MARKRRDRRRATAAHETLRRWVYAGRTEIDPTLVEALRGRPHAPSTQARDPSDAPIYANLFDDEDECSSLARRGRREPAEARLRRPARSNGRGSAKTVIRVHAVPPMKTAPIQAKTSRQTSDGTPICDSARTA